MARLFRFYEKKRGNRRTGSKKLGSLGELLFFGFFLVVGCAAALAILTNLVVPELRANRHFTSTRATVLDKRVVRETEDGAVSYRPLVDIQYQVEGRRYEASTYDVTGMTVADRETAAELIAPFERNKQYEAWYDPLDPARAVIVRGYSSWMYLFLLIPIAFIAIGTAGVIYTLLHLRTSAERMAAIQQRADRDLFEEEGDHLYPSVPRDDNVTNSPGTTLTYRLPSSVTPGWTLFALLVACLLWNLIVLVFAAMAAHTFIIGRPDWMMTLFVLPFLAVGIGLIVLLARRLLVTTGIGPTRLEISDHPLIPGREYSLFLSQTGRMRVRSFEVSLACDERATFRQGTDTRTEVRRVHDQQIFRRDRFEIQQGMPFERECRFRLPEGVMHSFEADHNKIDWKLRVKAAIDGWPEYERSFIVVVYPPRHHEMRP